MEVMGQFHVGHESGESATVLVVVLELKEGLKLTPVPETQQHNRKT